MGKGGEEGENRSTSESADRGSFIRYADEGRSHANNIDSPIGPIVFDDRSCVMTEVKNAGFESVSIALERAREIAEAKCLSDGGLSKEVPCCAIFRGRGDRPWQLKTRTMADAGNVGTVPSEQFAQFLLKWSSS